MAVLGKIRSRGMILIGIIGLGLLAFIAEEAFRSCEATRNNERQQIGEVYGKKISVQEFQKMVDEYTDAIKMQQGQENLNEEQLNQVKDMVWNSYVQSQLIEKEAEKLGLTVTDQELQNILAEGTNPMLLQTPFVNQQTGRFDAAALKKFLADYKAQKNTNPQMAEQYATIYKFWTFMEKQLRTQLLAQKYQNLLAHCFLSNPVEAKMAFKEENEESQIQLASLPYSSIDDSKIQVSESELKDKYNQLKPRFKQYVETRDIKYIDIQVDASATDKAALKKQFADYTKDIAAASDPTDVVRKSTSQVSYLGLPITKEAYPSDIAARLDSMSVGSVYGPVENAQDNTLNIIKLVAKTQQPDSIQYRQIQVMGATADAAHKTADSIYTALNNGADFEAIAKKYGQTGEKAWMTTRQYQNAPSMDKDTKAYITSLNTMPINEIKNIRLAQGNIIVQVLDRKGMITKYDAAVIKKTVDFSKDTYRTAYNKFSAFVGANQTAEAIIKNAAKSGYNVQEAKDISTAQHYLVNIRSTRDALKWLFEAKEGDVSPLYECGDNNHLFVVILNRINPVGYRSLKDAQVKEMVKGEVLKDKKAEQLMAKLNGVNSIAGAKAKGAIVSPVNQITFASPVFITATGASEPALSGAVAAVAKGAFDKTPVKGNAGVYMFQVTGRTMRPVKYDAQAQEQKLRQRAMQYAGNFMNELYLKAKVVDNRYLFF
ncbi:peptidylprolyl isomerase [Hoylesella saccharolytica]|uniref:peptidylprolyl isomerase n=1 Tax=Hoylesella saccharolytica TaxID=633701 RepID=UPI0004714FF2|nr:peptidylprolyl isomerase [Hoylesella saccharolytica]